MKPFRRLALLSLFAVLPMILPAAESVVPFRQLSLEDASKAAAKEGKLVFIDFYTTWCAPCKMLDAQTWTDAKVGQLVGEKAVPLKLDAEKEGRDAATRYKIDAYPTLLLLKADGTEVDRLVGFRDPGRFLNEFTLALDGKPTGVRVAEAVKNADSDHDAVKARQDRARWLARNGDHAEALAEYLWCFDEGMVRVRSFAGVRLSFLLSDIARLSQDYPPARTALEVRCKAAEERLLADPKDRNAGADFAALCATLGDESRLLALFDRFPSGDSRRTLLGYRAFKALREKGRYADALEVMPYKSMAMRFDSNSNGPFLDDRNGGDLNRRMAINNALDSIEVLAGAGDLEHARELIGKLVAYDETADTKKALSARLTTANRPELLGNK